MVSSRGAPTAPALNEAQLAPVCSSPSSLPHLLHHRGDCAVWGSLTGPFYAGLIDESIFVSPSSVRSLLSLPSPQLLAPNLSRHFCFLQVCSSSAVSAEIADRISALILLGHERQSIYLPELASHSLHLHEFPRSPSFVCPSLAPF